MNRKEDLLVGQEQKQIKRKQSKTKAKYLFCEETTLKINYIFCFGRHILNPSPDYAPGIKWLVEILVVFEIKKYQIRLRRRIS